LIPKRNGGFLDKSEFSGVIVKRSEKEAFLGFKKGKS
jgi:hypothetical protein